MTNSAVDEAGSGGLRCLLLPDWTGTGTQHWQRRWEALHGCERLQQDDDRWPRRGDWMARLDETLLARQTPTVLIAHGLGCHLVAAWAAHSQHTRRVLAAMLVAPIDTERDDMPPNLFNWRPIVRGMLPFPTLTVISRDDPRCAAERAAQMALDWGSAAFDAGLQGCSDDAAQLGDWPKGRALLDALLDAPPGLLAS